MRSVIGVVMKCYRQYGQKKKRHDKDGYTCPIIGETI